MNVSMTAWRRVAAPLQRLAVLLVLAGCSVTPTVPNSASLIELDEEWTRLFQERLQAEQHPDAATNVDAPLAKLSERAEARGDETSATDPANAVGFYRIAAAAAWTAGPPRNTQLLPIRDKGSAACEKLPQGPASQPRDCAFIRMAPDLANLDSQAATARVLRDAGILAPDQLDQAERVASAVTQSIQRVVEARTTAGATSESFDDYISLNLTRGFCLLPGLVGRIANSAPPAEQLERVRTLARGAQSALRDATISTTCNN